MSSYGLLVVALLVLAVAGTKEERAEEEKISVDGDARPPLQRSRRGSEEPAGTATQDGCKMKKYIVLQN